METLFNWYNGNIKDTKPRGLVSLKYFIEVHQNPIEDIKEVFEKIQFAADTGDKELKSKLKQENLYYFTPAAIFTGGRKYANIKSFTGLAQIDIDGLEHEEAIDLKHWLFENYQEFYCCYLSPSGQGVKGIIKIPVSKNVKEFKEFYQGIEDEFDWIAGFDSAPKNVALPLFLSIDENILYREHPNTWIAKGELQDATKLPNLTSQKPTGLTIFGDASIYKSEAYYKLITLQIFRSKIDSINDNGHPQLRSACLVLGSRCGAGYLMTGEAEQYAEQLIRSNSYLSKGIAGYITTMRWCIKNGYNNPKYYK